MPGGLRRLISSFDVFRRSFVSRFAAAHDLRNQPGDVHASSDLAAAWHASRRIPVIGIFESGIDVVADRGIQRPGFSQGGVPQMLGNAFPEKASDIGRFRNVLKLWQAGEIELLRGIAFGNWTGRRIGVGKRRLTLRRFCLALALRPAGQKALVFVAMVLAGHVRPVPSSREPPGARWRSPPARSRLRLWNTRSTWN